MTSRSDKPEISEAMLRTTMEAWAAASRRSRLPIQGTSMYPLLQPGDVALVTHDLENLQRGEVLAYWSQNHVVIHRLIRLPRGGLLLVCGDAHARPDPPVPVKAILGRVVAVETSAGRFSLASPLARRIGWLLATCSFLRHWPVLTWATSWLSLLAAQILRP